MFRRVFDLKCVGIFLTMEKTEYSAVIKYLHLKGKLAFQIQEDLKDTLADNTHSYATVKRWVAEFKRGRQTVEDEQGPEKPSTATTEETIDLVLDIVMEDRRLSNRQVADRIF